MQLKPTATELGDVSAPAPWTTAGHADPRAWYLAMLERTTIACDPGSGVWLYLGNEAVRTFLSEPDLWSTARRVDRVEEESRSLRLLTSDPPIHRQLRAHFANAYRPQRIVELERRTRAACEQILDACLGGPTFDIVTDFMKPMSLVVICELLGIPEDVRDGIVPLVGDASLGTLSDDPSVPLDRLLYDGKVSTSFFSGIAPIFTDLVARRRQEPRDDLITDLARIGPDELGGKVDLPALLFEQFGAGTNTTVHLFASMIHELDRQPDMLARIRGDRSIVEPFVEETLRLHSPLQARPRVLARDAVIDGVKVAEGTWGLGWIGAANVDPRVYEAPLEFRLDRDHRQHVTFGRNEHFCLGSHLARMELRVAMNTWLDKVGEFAPDGPDAVRWLEDFVIHGLERYRVRGRRA